MHHLEDHSRLKDFYGVSGVPLGGSRGYLTLNIFFNIQLVLNDVSVPSISAILNEAQENLSPGAMQDCILGVGHGDLHFGNILVSDSSDRGSSDSCLSLVYVDYGFTGLHSPWLDLAKPLYNDVFHSYFYADLLERDLIEDGVIAIEDDSSVNQLRIEFKPMQFHWEKDRRVGDLLGKALLDIMTNRVILPLLLREESISGATTGSGYGAAGETMSIFKPSQTETLLH